MQDMSGPARTYNKQSGPTRSRQDPPEKLRLTSKTFQEVLPLGVTILIQRRFVKQLFFTFSLLL